MNNAPLNSALLTAVLALSALASAQQTNQNRQLTPEMRARITQMQSINDLAQDIRLLPELEKNRATAMSKAQAKQLLPILTGLQKAVSVQPNDARKYLSQIGDRILTTKQRTTLNALTLKAGQERTAQRGQRQAGAGGRGGNAANAGGQNGQGGQFDPGRFNPFKTGRGADALKAYIAVLQKK
ncbi:hypothetical protein [Deinococcus marmoris]|uniref:Uncharacterized protein n=1 Tax=Deinococcus marmoris TaxID=249408 RepID=A0A1U7NXR6_9DEIO|nr:hypothetical protein [Deinococcus marmoris]OLV17715.1 hypothetical protein BOO71_0007987 [Deinococcus marmoris]